MQHLTGLRLGVWTEFLDGDSLAKQLQSLSEANMHLHLGVHLARDPMSYLPILERAKTAGVEIWAWPLLPESQGYWPNSSNAEAYQSAVLQLFDAWESKDIRVQGISIDFEPSVEHLRSLRSDLSGFRGISLWRTLTDRGRRDSLRAALPVYRSLTQQLKSRSYSVHAVTTPFILRDFETSTWKIRSALGLPIEPDLYDRISFMAYRSEYEPFMGPLGPELVTQVSRRAIRALGPKAGIDVGVAGDISFPHVLKGMRTAAEVAAEVTAAAQEGISWIQIYSLEGLINTGSGLPGLNALIHEHILPKTSLRNLVSGAKVSALNVLEKVLGTFLPG